MKHYLYLFLVLLQIVLVSCEEKGEDFSLQVSSTTLVFPQQGGQETLKVTSNTEWSVSGLPSWLSASAVSCSGIDEVTFTATTNPNEEDRTDNIIVFTINGGQEHIVAIRQKGRHSSPILVDKTDEKVFGGRKSIYYEDSIQISCDTSWKIEGPSWVLAVFNDEVLNMNGVQEYEGKGSIRLAASEKNNASDSREGIITIKTISEESIVQIPVRQLGEGDIFCYDVCFTADAFLCTVKVGSNIEKIVYFLSTNSTLNVTYDNFNNSGTMINANDGDDYNIFLFFTDYPFLTDTNYTLYMIGVDASNYYVPIKNVNKFTFRSLSEEDLLPKVTIKDVKEVNGIWQWTVSPNEHTKMYVTMLADKKEWDGLTPSQIAIIYASQNKLGTLGMVSDIERTFTAEDLGLYGSMEDVIIIAQAYNKNGNPAYMDIFDASTSDVASKPVLRFPYEGRVMNSKTLPINFIHKPKIQFSYDRR